MIVNNFIIISGLIISLLEVKTYAMEPLCPTPEPKSFIDYVEEDCKGKPSGAWFYKVETSSPNEDKGIRAKVTLPIFAEDPERIFDNIQGQLPEHTKGPLDRPSVYLGGSIGGSELDAGLTWDREYKDGIPTKNFSFRPFWRFKKESKKNTEWRNPKVSPKPEELFSDLCPVDLKNNEIIGDKDCNPENKYFDEGKSVEMELKELKRSTDGKTSTIMMRIKQDNKCFKACFEQTRGNPKIGNTWKRVNSIDQFKLGKCYVTGYKHLNKPSTREIPLFCKSSDIKYVNGKKVKTVTTVPCDELCTGYPLDENKKLNKPSKQFKGENDCRDGNERGSVISTNATITETKWEEVSIFQKDKDSTALSSNNSEIILGKEFCGKNKLDDTKHFKTTEIDKNGKQSIQIKPSFLHGQ